MKAFIATIALTAAISATPRATAEPWATPDDPRLRHDLELLNDTGAMNIPLTSWPLSWGDIGRGLADIDRSDLTLSQAAAYERVSDELNWQSDSDPHLELTAGVAEEPRLIRTFEDTPRADAEAGAALSWVGERLAFKLQAAMASNPLDNDEVRLDGTYVGIALGNWMLSAGWQDRWWGPGRDGSLILSTSARPAPGISFQRNNSTPFESKWLRWIGPWSVTSFLTQLDDERVINDARLFGLRVNFKPIDSLEIGLSRTAQWCGDDRPCDFSAFTDLLLGKDNRGVNVGPDEPGNQLAGFDLRWRLPQQIPVALYMQWIGEDSRRGGPEIGSWLRQVGIEHWGSIAGVRHRTHFEVSDTRCREGGFGFSDVKPDCGYEHSIYQTGYRYRGRAIGHAADGDSLAYSLGSTLVQSAGHSWNLTLRYMEINRSGAPNARHTVSATPRELADIQLTHDRITDIGRFHIGLGVSNVDDTVMEESSTDFTGFVQWTLE
jgi:hypothetical protein